MYKFLLIVPFLLASCSTVTIQGTAPCNGRIDITKSTRQFLRHTQYGTLYQGIHKPICTIPFKKGDKIDEKLTFCFLSGSELGFEVRHVHYTTVNKYLTLYDELIGKADFVPDCTEKIVIGDKNFTIHGSSSPDANERKTYQYSSHIEFMISTSAPHIK